MTLAMSGPLQEAIYALLSDDAALADVVGSAIYDAVPHGTLPPIYVLLGVEDVRDASDGTGAGALHQLTISVVTTVAGFAGAKLAAAAISDVLDGARPVLPRGRVIFIRFDRARARRVEGASTRQLDMRFLARVEDD